MLEDIVNIRNECLIFLHSWEMNLGEALSIKSSDNRCAVHGMCPSASPKFHFPWTQKKDTIKLVYIHCTSTTTSSVSLPCWRLPLVGIMVLTAVHLYVPVWRSWMFGIVSTGPVWLNVLSPTLVHLILVRLGVGWSDSACNGQCISSLFCLVWYGL